MLFMAPITGHFLTLIVILAAAQCFLGVSGMECFQKSWRKLVGLAEDQKPKNQLVGVVASFIGCFLLSFVLAHILGWRISITAIDGAAIGVVCWFGFMAPPLFVQHVFENRPANLFAINAGYWLLAMGLGGAILAAFH